MNKNEMLRWVSAFDNAELRQAVQDGREMLKYDASTNIIFALFSASDLEKMGLENNWFRAGGRTGYHSESLPPVPAESDCIGIELETEGERCAGVRLISNLFGASRDGSLYDGGCECIFRAIPVTSSGLYHFASVILPKVAALLASSGLTSWKGGRCGLHLHRSIAAHPEDWRRVFEANYADVSLHENELARMFRARHYDGGWNQVASKLHDALAASGDFALALAMCQDAPNTAPVQAIRSKIRKEIDKKTMQAMNSRSFIGIGNSRQTIEYRLGRGSLRPERLQMEVVALFRMSEGRTALPSPDEPGRLAALVRRCHAAIFGGEEG